MNETILALDLRANLITFGHTVFEVFESPIVTSLFRTCWRPSPKIFKEMLFVLTR